MHNIIYSEKSKEDLNKIYFFISQDSLKNANNVIANLVMQINNLTFFPELGRKFGSSNRILIDSKYKYEIYYLIKNKNIEIISVRKNKKNIF